MIDFGFRVQRLANKLWGRTPFVQKQVKAPPATVGKAPLKAQVIHFINKPMPGGLPKRTSRALLDIEDATTIPIIRDAAKAGEDSDAVFYFPGCGSERLFGQVGLATQALLYHVGSQCVLPPGYLCCGYPQTSAGRADQGEKITIQNRVLFHRVGQHAELPRHQDGGGLVRHLHGPAAEVRIREDLPRLPAARHPRVPDGEGASSSTACRVCATCTTTPATRR
jgi:hypothetical protein